METCAGNVAYVLNLCPPFASNPDPHSRFTKNRGMIFPLAFISLLGVILVPLPTGVLDILLIFNLTLSVIVMVTTIYVQSPLEFAVFPSLLLALTMFRLVLNVATVRLILTAGDRASSAQSAMTSAGDVIFTFADFVTKGSLAVGVIIFTIIVVIQFVVITKGATRISEVAARFTLDAMPGKQMAIDADLNAGIINEAEARKRRGDIAHEADFYGAMDGASKFVRGDAIAAIVITFVNVLGGLYVGMFEHGWNLMDCLQLYTKLTIGDGLVSQIPAFIVSLAAGLIVTRTSSKSNLGDEVLSQVFTKPKALVIAAVFLGLMMFTGLPKFPLVVMGSCCGGTGDDAQSRRAKNTEGGSGEGARQDRQEGAGKSRETSRTRHDGAQKWVMAWCAWWMSAKGGDLLDRVSLIRRQIAVDLGIIMPPVRIRDNLQLGANDYVVKIKGQAIGKGVAYPEQFLAMDSGASSGPITGATQTIEPAFGSARLLDHRAAAPAGGAA